MTAPDEASLWRWIAPDGSDGSGSHSDLVDRLKRRELPATTYVWRSTWLEWLPAWRVAELAAGFPKPKVERPIQPKRSPTALDPPVKPAFAAVARELPRHPGKGPPAAGGEKGATAPLLPTSFGSFGRPPGPSVLGPPRGQSSISSRPPRAPMATLRDEPPLYRSTLRPPGAVPPPPRGLPHQGWESSAAQTRIADEPPTSRRESALPSELRAAVVVPEPPDPIEINQASSPASRLTPAPDLDATPGSAPFEVTAQDFVELGPQSTTTDSAPAAPHPLTLAGLPSSPTVPPRRRARRRDFRLTTFGWVVVAAALVAVAVIALSKSRRSEQSTAPRRATPAAPPPPETPPFVGCRIAQPPARLSAGVHRPVTPIVSALPQSPLAALGFAETPRAAVGLTVDLGTLDASRVFEQAGDGPIVAVVPLAVQGAPGFTVDREDTKRRRWRTLDTTPPVSIAAAGDDWVRKSSKGSSVLWTKAAAGKTTDPRAVKSAAGELVTFRRGGLTGRVLYGWIGPDGAPKAEVTALEPPGVKLSGTPDAAVNARAWLIAFAGRPTAEAEWRVQLATAPLSGGKPRLGAFSPPPGGTGGGSIAPAVSGLAEDGFVLQWTEGHSGQYQVRVQRLGPELEALGEPVLVSPKGANAGQGSIFASGARVLSLFVQTTGGHDELWGAALECP